MDTHNYFEEIGVFPRGAGKVFHAYLIGYVLSLLLTLIAFVLTITHAFPYDDALIVLVILALIQFGVQAQCFLHLGSESRGREKLVIFAGACVVVLILVSGSIWIMFTLNSRMMPSEAQMEQYMDDQAGDLTMFKQYYRLAKPGIVYGNILTTIAAFLYASRWHIDPVVFIATILGMALVIASACVFNNFLDRDIDTLMARTKNRALAQRTIPARTALIFATILAFFGFAFLYICVNALTALVAFIGFVFYVFVYTFSKRKTPWGTVLGSVSGAMPIVAGYTAVTNALSAPAFILFLILALWQLPHFYAIAIYRLADYRAANIPVLPAVKGIGRTKAEIVLYILAFLIASCGLAVFGFAGSVYFTLVFAVGLAWLVLALQGYKNPDDTRWARTVFFFSLIVILLFSIILALAPLFP